jgi:hypothetical protein|tara:strand:+ start:1228 stop:1494 length:267 start_codon:yes stop_codon:yes gene_type:complete
MKLDRENLKEMIRETISLKEGAQPAPDAAQGDMTQDYINFLVAVQESAREALEDIERGEDPHSAATNSKFNQLVRSFSSEEFHDYFFG